MAVRSLQGLPFLSIISSILSSICISSLWFNVIEENLSQILNSIAWRHPWLSTFAPCVLALASSTIEGVIKLLLLLLLLLFVSWQLRVVNMHGRTRVMENMGSCSSPTGKPNTFEKYNSFWRGGAEPQILVLDDRHAINITIFKQTKIFSKNIYL